MKNLNQKRFLPIEEADAFIVLRHAINDPAQRLHYHDYWELLLFQNSETATCIIGNSITKINHDTALFLLPPGTLHGWCTGHNSSSTGLVKQVIFQQDLFGDCMLNKNQFFHIRKLFQAGINSIRFSNNSAQNALAAIQLLEKENDFKGLLILLKLLSTVSLQKQWEILNDNSETMIQNLQNNTNQVNKVMDYLNTHFKEEISLKKMSCIMNMSEATLARFFKMQTGKCFTDLLIEKRISYATKLLIESNDPIHEIAYQSGFNQVTHFNRLFKAHTGFSPKMYKQFLLSSKTA
ncbi:MAG: AraC family transcriptional regulator [Hydrotalea flava]|uniref:AraC family transcriptional regulator n=1 Tax=Hydrotalea TaxID=1004300 RepID=UPI0009437A87|nr:MULTISPECIES: AraC family transcriptional regulator [Hydrotalea]MBY0348117.1 AraC family transcriptional regulator [Hydrotalea flava]RWZ89689.1 MAG: AraC family transcriptional regulator [Hydrotalea sp. AMD]RWZ90064.1 MAG: AraC family transcriptional regulator [Hydrotalea sp. AMD]